MTKTGSLQGQFSDYPSKQNQHPTVGEYSHYGQEEGDDMKSWSTWSIPLNPRHGRPLTGPVRPFLPDALALFRESTRDLHVISLMKAAQVKQYPPIF